MNNLQTTHLTEDELDEVLLGFASEDATMHAAACEPCGVRLEVFRSQMAVFSQASMAWSEARSNTISRDLAAHKPRPRLSLTAVWSSAATLMVALAFGVTIAMHQAPPAPAFASHPEHDVQELASDNEMLSAINSEFGAPRPARLGLYEKTTVRAQRVAQMQVRD